MKKIYLLCCFSFLFFMVIHTYQNLCYKESSSIQSQSYNAQPTLIPEEKSFNEHSGDMVIYLNTKWNYYKLDNIKGNNSFVTIGHFHNNMFTLGDSTNTNIDEKELNYYISARENIFYNKSTAIYYAKDYYTKDSTGYSNITNKDILLKSNVDWDLTPWAVKYQKYDTPSVPFLQDEIHQLYEVVVNEFSLTKSPVVIRESWSFIYDNNKVLIVNAGNLINEDEFSEKNKNIIYDYREDDIIYSLSAVFINGELISYKFSRPPLSPYKLSDEDCNTTMYYTYQTNNDGKIIKVPFYPDSTISRTLYLISELRWPTVSCIIDIDNDSLPEILFCERDELSVSLTSYKINNNSFDKYMYIYSPNIFRSTIYPLEFIER